VISTDTTYTGAGTVTPPAVGMCSADRVVLAARQAAPWTGTGLTVAGTASPFRLRGLTAAGFGTTVRPSVQTTALPGAAVVGVPVEHPSSTPGDLPPEDPLS
jgi:phage tail tape-measure protein